MGKNLEIGSLPNRDFCLELYENEKNYNDLKDQKHIRNAIDIFFFKEP